MWQGCGLSIGAWHVGVVILVPETTSKKLRPMHYGPIKYVHKRVKQFHFSTRLQHNT